MQHMHWFIDPIKHHYADFDGRVGRQEFWMFVAISVGIQIILDIIGLVFVAMLLGLALLVPTLALGARRLHDMGRSGWWQLIGIIPVVGWIILIIWLATKTDSATNEYGAPAVAKTAEEGTSPAAAAPIATTTTQDSSVPVTPASTTPADTTTDATSDSSADTASSSDSSSGSSSN
ncbi:MAG: DUF805 domain-containing protein [Patescibacteria group bacterium]